MHPSSGGIEELFQTQIETLALTLRPGTLAGYRWASRRFLSYLHAAFPQLHEVADLRRDPHLLGWFRSLCEQRPPLSNRARALLLLALRRLLHDLADNGHSLQSDLIRSRDLPPQPRYLAKPLSAEDDHLLQQELRRTGDLPATALLLTRATGIRIGECIDLPLDCLRQIGPDHFALHVPLGKLNTERLVPVDDDVRQMVARILKLRVLAPPVSLNRSADWLLPRSSGHGAMYQVLALALAQAAKRAQCSSRPTPHRLRHTYASEMVRLGVSLPALMQLLGHKDIRMTLRYVEVTQPDLQREFHAARQRTAQLHAIPVLSVPNSSPSANLPSIRQAITAARHLLEMYRRRLTDDQVRRQMQRLDHRLLAIVSKLEDLDTAEK
jgi:site-specific recombinase XerD